MLYFRGLNLHVIFSGAKPTCFIFFSDDGADATEKSAEEDEVFNEDDENEDQTDPGEEFVYVPKAMLGQPLKDFDNPPEKPELPEKVSDLFLSFCPLGLTPHSAVKNDQKFLNSIYN